MILPLVAAGCAFAAVVLAATACLMLRDRIGATAAVLSAISAPLCKPKGEKRP